MAKAKMLRAKELIRLVDGEYLHFSLKKKYDMEKYGIVPVGDQYVVCEKTKKKYDSKKYSISEEAGKYSVYEHSGTVTRKEAKQFLVDIRSNVAALKGEAEAQVEYDRLMKEFKLDEPIKLAAKEKSKKKKSDNVVQFLPSETKTKLFKAKKVTKKPAAKNVAKKVVKKVSKVVKNVGNK